MKANELRIGNLILKENTEIKVTASTLMDMQNKDSDYYSPIPLTEEWLLKFGFEKSYPDGEDGWPWWTLNYVELVDYGDELEYNVTDRQFKYVHTLQNLYFALTGEELQIS